MRFRGKAALFLIRHPKIYKGLKIGKCVTPDWAGSEEYVGFKFSMRW